VRVAASALALVGSVLFGLLGSARRSETHDGGRQDGGREEPGISKTAAKGRTAVTVYKPFTYDEPRDGPKLNEVQLIETFTGDIQGEGKARVLQAQWADGSLEYTTIERVIGALAGRTGTFLLQVDGTVHGKHNKGAWSVTAGSGTGELRGLRGEGGFDAELGRHGSWRLDYWFE
jgi:hypothetical protein